MRAFAPRMPSGGRIVLVSSVLGRFGVPRYGGYCAAKHGLIGLAKALGLELIGRGIFVNAVAPGWVETQMAEKGLAQRAAREGTTPAAVRALSEADVPVGRFFRPEEVARADVLAPPAKVPEAI